MDLRSGANNRGKTGLAIIILIVAAAAFLICCAPTVREYARMERQGVCAANRRSLEQELQIAYTEGGDECVKTRYQELAGKYVCPDGGVITYEIDENTGKVSLSCDVHGH